MAARAVLLAALWLCSGQELFLTQQQDAPAATALPPKWKLAGVTFTGGRYCPNVTLGSATARQSLERLASTGANFVAIVVTGYQWNITSTEILKLYNGSEVRDSQNYYEFVTETDDAVRRAIRDAKALGLGVLLKPHVDLLSNGPPGGDYWRGDIGGCPTWGAEAHRPFSPSQWDAWFKSYAAFLLPYAEMAQEEGVEMLSMNCELYCPNRQEKHWRALVAEVRAAYSGKLTVAQIHGHEAELKWWDAVDVIGIDAYYELNWGTLDELVASWAPYRELAKNLSSTYQRPVAYTEIGFCSGNCDRGHRPDAKAYSDQALDYESTFLAFQGQEDWFLGAFWWNWNTDPGKYAGDDDCLTPQQKPAEGVLRKYYRATVPKLEPVGAAACMGFGRCTC